MAWQNLDEELGELFSSREHELSAPGVHLTRYGEHLKEARRLLAERRSQYDARDRNRTYTVRKAVRAYQRGAVCANDATGRFVKRTA